jgi:hypothetical protein
MADEEFADGFGEVPGPSLPAETDFKIPRAADAFKPERSEAAREAQRMSSIKDWKRRDRIAGVPPPVRPQKAPPASKRTAIEKVLLMQRAENLHIKAALEEFVRRTIEELGGWGRLTAGQKGMLVCQKFALMVVLCCEDAIVEGKSLMEETGKPHPLLGVMEKYMTTFRQGQVALGLGLRSRMMREDNLTLKSVMREYEARQSKPVLVPRKGKPGGGAA